MPVSRVVNTVDTMKRGGYCHILKVAVERGLKESGTLLFINKRDARVPRWAGSPGGGQTILSATMLKYITGKVKKNRGRNESIEKKIFLVRFNS